MNRRPRTQTMGAGGRDVLLQCLRHDQHSHAVRYQKVLSDKTAPFVVSGHLSASTTPPCIEAPSSLPGPIERTTDAHVGTKCRI